MLYDGRKPWTAREEEFVRDNIGKLSLDEIAKKVYKTPTAVRQFIHRKRIHTEGKVVRNLVTEILVKRFVRLDYFKPTRSFYQAVGMTQKRWWCVYYGEVPLTDEEYKRLTDHFGVELDDVKGSLQLSLFEDGNCTGGN